MPECDRLSYARDRTLVEHAVKEMARVYRREIGRGLKLFINNRRLEAVDPTYAMPNARHAKVQGIKTKTSKLVVAKGADHRAENLLGDSRSHGQALRFAHPGMVVTASQDAEERPAGLQRP